jgi:hypothetical protein
MLRVILGHWTRTALRAGALLDGGKGKYVRPAPGVQTCESKLGHARQGVREVGPELGLASLHHLHKRRIP